MKRVGDVPRRHFVAQRPLGRAHVERANHLIAQAGEIGDAALFRDQDALGIEEHGRPEADAELHGDRG